MAKQSVPDILEQAAATYRERHLLYGDNYKLFGAVMMALFPSGMCLTNPADMVRFGLIQNIVTKLARYCMNLDRGGHQDSAHDLMVYAAMLEEMTDELKSKNQQ